MYSQSYDDYMRSILGYSNSDGYRMDNMNPMGINNMHNMNNMGMNSINMNAMGMKNMGMNMSNDEDIEHLYPEVYRVVYPMVCSSCDRMQFPGTTVNEDIITRMTNDIYDQVEADGRIKIEANVTTEVRETSSSSDSSVETRQRRRPRNRFLNDLIRILLLRELSRRRRFPGRFPIRPF